MIGGWDIAGPTHLPGRDFPGVALGPGVPLMGVRPMGDFRMGVFAGVFNIAQHRGIVSHNLRPTRCMLAQLGVHALQLI